jgi:hypothetical protein
MLSYETLRTKPKELLALTGLARREFEELVPVFAQALHVAEEQTRPAPRRRQRAPGGGRKPSLRTVEDQLLFALIYTKTYPLQVVQGQLFGMSQSSANEWIHFLVPILAMALGDLPEREGAQAARHERRQVEPPDLIVDGVERRRQRPKNRQKQALHYSGKKKLHTDKNVVLVSTHSKRVSYLSLTLPGVVHDKALADWVNIQYPPATILRSDLGFCGYQPPVRQHLQPKKVQAGGTNAWPKAPQP